MISCKNDFMILELDETLNLHMTLIYARKLGATHDLIEAFKIVLKVLNTYPDLIEEYSKLEYFGEKEIQYWYDCEENMYPFNVKCPENYISQHSSKIEIPKKN